MSRVLFDGNRLDNEQKRAAKQLAESQYSDGSWSWFPGGPANDFITLYITTGYGRLRHLGVKVNEQPAIKSLNRLDGWINSTYQRIKRNGDLDENNLVVNGLPISVRSQLLFERPNDRR